MLTKMRAIKILAAAVYMLTATTLSAQSILDCHIVPYDEYQPVDVPGWKDDRSPEPATWNAYRPMKMILGFEPAPYACYSNFLSFQIADGNIALYPSTSENAIIHGRGHSTEDETKQTNTFMLNVGSQICRFKLVIQTFEAVDEHWQIKNTGQIKLVDKALLEISKKIRDESIPDTERSKLTAERERLEVEIENNFGDDKDRVEKALASKGFKGDQISNRVSLKVQGFSEGIPYFSSNSPATKECFFGSGHIDFSGVNPSLTYVASPPTERPDDNWFEVRAGYSTSGNGYDIFFSNRKCAIRIEFSKEMKKSGNWISLPVSKN
ncbi:hypothetical protein [Methylobacterium sp. J-077]|uniref:hypothetical protein n=1 Tax=Methylobacterium sp. J-077 TaxID=2836656 RepID=UPI001FB8DF21|nr:hypothetical protein [Methylobacterium sp. J-077]MCJ2123443.1 hypothetical protein [Methylobacterium sp. J-077]